MSYEVRVENEEFYIDKALEESDKLFDKKYSATADDLKRMYNSLIDALISWELLKKNNLTALTNYGTDMGYSLESRILKTVLLLSCEDPSTDYKKSFVESPWGKKMKNPNYLRRLWSMTDDSYKVIHEALYD